MSIKNSLPGRMQSCRDGGAAATESTPSAHPANFRGGFEAHPGSRAGRAACRAAVLLGPTTVAVLAMAGTAFAHIKVTPASSRQEDQDQP